MGWLPAITRRRRQLDLAGQKPLDEMLTSICGNSNEGLNKLGFLTAPMKVWVQDWLAVILLNSSPFNFFKRLLFQKIVLANRSACQLRLILADPTAIGVGLSHASCAFPSHGGDAAHGSVTRG